MSNKTTFKRIALAVVAALGFGVLASAPSSAAVISLTVTPANGTATTLVSDSTTAGTLTVGFTSNSEFDSVTVSSFILTDPTPSVATDTQLVLMAKDTATSTLATTVRTNSGASGILAALALGENVIKESVVVVTGPTGTRTGQLAAKFHLFFSDTQSTLTAGTYVVRSVVTPYNAGVIGTSVTSDVSIVVTASAAQLAQLDTVIDPAQTIAVLSNIQAPDATVLTADSALAVSSTASATPKGYVRVQTFNANGDSKPESVTATISGAGILATSDGALQGTSIKVASSGDTNFRVLSDGRAGVGSIVIATTSKTFPAKTITFYAAAPATVTPSVRIPVVGTSAKTALRATALDANGNVWGGQAYLFSQDTAIATAGACSFIAALGVHDCSVTGVAAGQSSFKIGNGTTEALSTVLTAAFDGPRVTTKTAASVKIEFDKAAYAPGEKALVYVTPLDDAGLGVVGGSLAGILATGGITSSVAFSSGSDTVTATELQVAEITSATTGAKAGSAMYTVYMPFGKGTVTLSATGGTSLPVAGRVAVTASADVVDDSVDAAVDAAQEATDAAIAATDAAILAQEAADEAASAAIAAQETAQAAVDAVTALSAEVTKLVAQLATLQKLLNRVAKRVGVKL